MVAIVCVGLTTTVHDPEDKEEKARDVCEEAIKAGDINEEKKEKDQNGGKDASAAPKPPQDNKLEAKKGQKQK